MTFANAGPHEIGGRSLCVDLLMSLAVSSGITRLSVVPTLLGAAVVLIAPRHSDPALAGTTSLRPAHFAPAPGWQVKEGGAHACVGVSASRCLRVTSVASTTRFRDCLDCLPHRTSREIRLTAPRSFCSPGDGEKPPWPLDSLELIRPPILEAKCGAGDYVLHRLGCEHLAARCLRHHACGEVHGDAA